MLGEISYHKATLQSEGKQSIHYSLHENEKPVFSNSSGLKSVFKMLRFHDGLVWTVGLTVESKLRFQFLRRTEDAVLTTLRIKLKNLEEKHNT